jgi:hypothetical protein
MTDKTINNMETKNIYQKLQSAREAIKTSAVKKDGYNTYGKYSYFTPENIEALVSHACNETKTMCLTSLRKDVNGYFQELTFLDPLLPAEKLVFELRTEMPAITATNASQQMGGMDTYSERYIKMKIFQIKDNSLDFDAQDNRDVAEEPKKTFKPDFAPKATHPDQYAGNGKTKKGEITYEKSL